MTSGTGLTLMPDWCSWLTVKMLMPDYLFPRHSGTVTYDFSPSYIKYKTSSRIPFHIHKTFFYGGMLDCQASDQSDTEINKNSDAKPVRNWTAPIPDRFRISLQWFKRNFLLGLPLAHPLRHWVGNVERKAANSIIMALLTVLLVIYLIH